MRTLFTSIRSRLAAVLLGLGAALASCGGGDSPSAPVQYTSVAMAGELVTYTVDPLALTYSYTITESQFGLKDKTGSGTLVRNANGSYTPSGIPNARIVILPNGLLLGAVYEDFGAGRRTVVPILGIQSPVSTIGALATTYNYVHRACVGAAFCALDSTAVGTFVIADNNTWSSCPEANLAAGACPSGVRNGTLESAGNGLWRVMEGTANVGTALGFNSGGQNVLLIDLKDWRLGGLGVGMVVGAQQVELTPGPQTTDGTWITGTSTGHWAVFTTQGTDITVINVDGLPANETGTFTANSPWQGMVATDAGTGFLAGNGVYVFETNDGGAQIGIKLR